MIPRILELGPIPLNSFGLMVALAVFAAIYRLQMSFAANGIDQSKAEKYVLTGALVGLAGARVWYIIVFYPTLKEDLLGAVFSGAGFIFYGGFIAATVTLIAMSQIEKIPLSKFLDSMGPTLALGYAVGRVGCQLSGDGDYGMATTSIFGMSYEHGVIPTPPGVFAFPTPLYESILALGVLFLLLKADKITFWLSPYRRFGLYLACMSVERFLIEFLRLNPRIALGLSQAQFISIGLFLVGLILCSGILGLQEKKESHQVS